MTEEKLFHKNVDLWAHLNPKAAVYLPYLDCAHLTFCNTKDDQLNLKIVTDNVEGYFHSKTDPQEESKKWFSQLQLADIDVIYVFGIGLGYYYDAANEWLKQEPNRRLIFLENDLAIIHRLFETEKGTEILNDSQVKLHYFDNLEDSETVLTPLSDLYWESMTTKVLVTALSYYAKSKEELFTQLHHKIIYDLSMLHAVLDEYLHYGYTFYKNFYPNMLRLEGAFLANGLFNKFPKIPAIICGAGPSLNKHLPILDSLKDRALIFAGGSSLNALNAAGIQPHFGAGVDPNPPQLERITKNNAIGVPFLYRNRLYHPALCAIKGPRLYITGSGGYDTSDWIEDKFEIDHTTWLDEGFNVVNLCLSVAHAFGCDPIIFVGMDLAYTEMQKYAAGIEEQPAVVEKEITENPDFNERAILRKDIFGNPLYTLWKWVAESNWISAFAKAHPDVAIINATEGGLGFPNILNEPLSSLIKEHLKDKYDLSALLQEEIKNSAMPQVTHAALVTTLEELHDSLIRCKVNLDLLMEETGLIVEQIQRTKQIPKNLQSGRAALCEVELAEEPAYNAVLEMFNVIYSKVLNRNLQALRSLPEWKKTVKKLELNSSKLAFLRNVAEVNAVLIQEAMKSAEH